jgi:hypothetical protein
VDFLHFLSGKIYVSLTDIISSFSPPRFHLSSGQCCHTAMSCHASFSWSQDELATSASFSDNASSRHLFPRAKTKALNPHHHRWPSSPDRLTLTLHYYKKGHLNLAHSLDHSTTSPFYLLPSQSTTLSELHPPSSFPFTVVPCPLSLHTMTPTVMNYPSLFHFLNNLSACELT